MKFIGTKTIKYKIMVMFMLLSVIILLLVSGAFSFYGTKIFKANTIAELNTVSSITSARIAPLIMLDSIQQIRDVLSSLKNKHSIVLVCAYDYDSNLITYYNRNDSHSCKKTLANTSYTIDSKHVHVANNVTLRSGEVIGKIYIRSDLSDLTNNIQELTTKMLWVFAAVFTISYILSNLLHRPISKPLANLVNAASQVEKGNYEIRAKKFNNDEVGRLSTTFNSMMEYIRERDALLEEMVIERTAKLQDALKDAEAAAVAKSEFLANMSHELRTPIHGIMNFAKFGMNDIKRDKLDPTKMLKYLNTITTSSTRMSKLIDHLLDLSKSEAGMVEYNFERKDIIDITDRTVSELSSILDTKNLTVELNSSEPEMFVYIDELRIVQVIYNIMSNAMKFSEKESAINVDIIYLENNQISISISNTGVGIMEEELEKVFDKFIQGTKTKTGAGGTGLGLSISKGIIEAHDGKIWAENSADDRTIFIFTLPTELTAKQINEDRHVV